MRPIFTDYRSLDIIGGNLFSASISDIPAASGLDKTLSIRCQGFELPGVEQGRLECIMQSFKFYNSSGSSIYSGEFTIRYLEDSNYTINKLFRAWKEFTAGTISGTTGGSKVDYARDILLEQFNPRGESVGQITVSGCFPVGLPNITAESSQTPEPMILECRFSFDTYSIGSVQNR